MFALVRCLARVRATIVLVLACTLGSGGMLPVWAQLAGVEGPHVCHCSTDHHDCVCARCHTDGDAKRYRTVETVKGRCGDDEVGFGGHGVTAVLAAGPAPLPAADATEHEDATPPRMRPLRRSRPPTPPPRSA